MHSNVCPKCGVSFDGSTKTCGSCGAVCSPFSSTSTLIPVSPCYRPCIENMLTGKSPRLTDLPSVDLLVLLCSGNGVLDWPRVVSAGTDPGWRRHEPQSCLPACLSLHLIRRRNKMGLLLITLCTYVTMDIPRQSRPSDKRLRHVSNHSSALDS
jgi:hypothetical protein